MEVTLGYVGLALGILGIVIGVVVSYYFYRKSHRAKEPVYSIKSNNLISGSISTFENLTIAYKEKRIENLTVSKILIYNRGAETITRRDIETINPLSFSTEVGEILDASVLQVNHPSNNLSINHNPGNDFVYIEFDYLDRNQGAVIQVIHTGLSSEFLEIHGDVVGVQALMQINPKQLAANKPMTRNDKVFIGAWVFVTLLFWLFTLLGEEALKPFTDSANGLVNLLVAIIGLGGIVGTVAVVLGVIMVIVSLFSPDYKLPKGLEKFLE